jgi:hypothetical protein
MIKSGESPGFYGSYQRTIVILKLFPVLRAILICASLIGWCQWASGQSACVSEHDVDRMLTQAKGSTKRSANPELHDALLKLKEDGDRLFQNAFIDLSKDDRVTERMRSFRERNTSELCPVLQKFGWPGADIAGPDGEAAAFFLLKNSS